jgi:hypothetical protein
MRRAAKIINILFWLGIWVGVMWWTDAFGSWLAMSAEGVLPLMLWFFFHYALRAPETGDEHNLKRMD